MNLKHRICRLCGSVDSVTCVMRIQRTTEVYERRTMNLKHRIHRLLVNLKQRTDRLFCVITACLAAVFGLNASVFGDILRVDGTNGTCAGDGSGWGASAYRYLQDALAAANGVAEDQIWVRAGTYYADQDCANPMVAGTARRPSRCSRASFC